MKKFLLPVLCTLPVAAAYAQVANNTALVGTVTDPSGAALAGAKVTATNEATKVSYTGNTNGEGYYSISFIQPGVYDISIEKDGFANTVSKGTTVQLNMAARTDAKLQVGSAATEVSVTAATPALSTDDALIGETLSSRQVTNLPVAGRHPMDLAATASNVIVGPKTSFTGNPPGANYIGAGTREVTNSLTLDGITIMNSLGSSSPVTPGPDQIGAVQTQTGNYTAQYGAYMGIHINMDTKAGTNDFHGTIYDFVQNDALNAKSFFTLPTARIPELRFNQFGGEVSGPVIIPKLFNGKDKLFFMGGYEGQRQTGTTQATATVLTQAMRNGDFSAVTTPLKNPATGAAYANNQVTNISPISTALLQYMPLPNVAGITNNLNTTVPQSINDDETLNRVDYVPTERVRLFGRYLWQKLTYVSGSPIPTSDSYSPTTDSNGAFGYTQFITPTLVNDFHFGYNKLTTDLLNAFAENNIQGAGAALGIQGFNSDVTNNNPGIPSINITNFQELGSDGTNWYQDDRTLHGYDQISWTKGRHNIMAGADLRKMSIGRAAQNTPRGSFTFSGRYSGYSAADFLTGYAGTVVTPITQIKGSVAEWRDGFFVQDNWQVSQKLTLLYGLRYELPTVPYSLNGYGRVINRDYTALIPTSAATTGASYTPDPGFKFIGPNHNDWAPRVGFAYRANQRVTLRGGGGIYYNPNHLNSFTLATGNFPLAASFTYNGPTSGLDNLTFANPTGTGAPSVSCVPGNTGCYTSVFNDDYHLPTPRLYQWNGDVDTELWQNAGLEVQYLGSRGVHLDYSYYPNQPAPGPGNINARRPNQLFGQIRQIEDGAFSTYNGLSAIFRQRLSHGLEMNLSYTWAHSLDASSDANSGSGGTPMIPNDIKTDYGNSTWDIRNRFVGVVTYTLPSFNNLNRATRLAVGGWTLNTIVTLQSGQPMNIGLPSGLNQSNTGTSGTERPVGIRPGITHCSADSAINKTSCIQTDGVYTLPNSYAFGNVHRDDLYGPGLENVNLSVFKDFQLYKRLTFQFRAEAFNMFNHFNPANPNTTLGGVHQPGPTEIGNPATGGWAIDPATGTTKFDPTSSFGTITTVQNSGQNGGGARLLQLAGKINF